MWSPQTQSQHWWETIQSDNIDDTQCCIVLSINSEYLAYYSRYSSSAVKHDLLTSSSSRKQLRPPEQPVPILFDISIITIIIIIHIWRSLSSCNASSSREGMVLWLFGQKIVGRLNSNLELVQKWRDQPLPTMFNITNSIIIIFVIISLFIARKPQTPAEDPQNPAKKKRSISL